MRKFKKNINQTDLLELLGQLEQLEQVSTELTMLSALGELELNFGVAGVSETKTPIWTQSSIDALLVFNN